ncbi:hypothetical protein [Sphingopyxis sp. H115]|uniref:hypothetical protein n=1 Tax=Sphingopyxis sp. H115 TaxID=1759073 RepID=UPI0007361B52|nr:hypothetical protein [Sphingopyxis sp. H115]KTE13784.1 hypothetical protein ATE71_09825 [Sphingopyxis sp. H115]
MFIVEPTAVVIAAYVTALVTREMPRLFALLIVRIAVRLSAARHTQIVEAVSGRQVPVTWAATSEDRKLLHAAMRSTMRVTTFRSLYPLSR